MPVWAGGPPPPPVVLMRVFTSQTQNSRRSERRFNNIPLYSEVCGRRSTMPLGLRNSHMSERVVERCVRFALAPVRIYAYMLSCFVICANATSNHVLSVGAVCVSAFMLGIQLISVSLISVRFVGKCSVATSPFGRPVPPRYVMINFC